MRELLGVFIGYLLGSVLPAIVFGRMSGVDIREVGTGNPGTQNAVRELGTVAGVITGVYDTAVGLLAVYVAQVLGLSSGWMYASGVAAVIGHRFPVFFGFRGGEGMAASTALLAWAMWVATVNGWLSVAGIGALVIVAFLVYALTRESTVIGVVTLPLLWLQIIVARPDLSFALFLTAIAFNIWWLQLGIARDGHLLRLAEPVRAQIDRWRVAGR
jgi:glycerol-3-phosphate acyltransferase PlsY